MRLLCAAALVALAAAKPGDGASVDADHYCASNFATDKSKYGGWKWDFSFLGNANYSYEDPDTHSVWTWNYCKEVDKDLDAFAIEVTSAQETFPWGTEAIAEDDFHGECNEDEEGTITSCAGANFKISSSDECIAATSEGADDAVYYGFKTVVQCVPTPEGQEAAEIAMGGVTVSADGCTATVTFSGPDACATFSTTQDKIAWLSSYTVLGPMIGIFGMRLYFLTMPVLVWTTVCLLGFLASASLQLTATWTGYLVTLALCVVLSTMLGCWGAKKLKNSLGVAGACSGAFVGLYVFTIVSVILEGCSIWILWAIVGPLAGLGFILGLNPKFGIKTVLWGTSFSGSYLFTRSITAFFSNCWPSEASASKIDVNTTMTDIAPVFWVFAGAMLVLTLVWGCMQDREGYYDLSVKNIDDQYKKMVDESEAESMVSTK